MTSFAKAKKIITFESQFRIFVIVLKVMDCRCFTHPSVSLASLTLISVSAQYRSTFRLPCCTCIEITHVNYFLSLRAVVTLKLDRSDNECRKMVHHAIDRKGRRKLRAVLHILRAARKGLPMLFRLPSYFYYIRCFWLYKVI